MSFFFEEDTALQVKSTDSISKGERTDFMENASKAFNAFRRSEMFTSEGNNQEEEYINIVDILTAAGHTNYISPLEVNTDPLNEDGDMSAVFKTRDELQKEFWQQVALLQTTDQNLKTKLTEAGLDNFENMQKTIATKTHNAWKDYTEVNERATTAGWWGGMGGMAGAAFTDPIMLMTIPISFGYSVPAGFSAAALKIALMEGIIGGVAETVIQLKAQPYRAELGFEDAGLVTGLKNVGMVTLASGTLSPLLFGTFKAFGKGIKVGKKFLHKQTPEDLQTIYKEMGDINPKLKDKDLTEYELPKKDSPFEDTAPARVEHNERLDTTARAIENGEPVDLPPIRSTLETPTPTKIEFNDITASNPAIKNTYDEVQKMVTVYRGERANAPGIMYQYIKGTNEVVAVPYSDKLKGRFYTKNLEQAKSFADDPSSIKSITISEKDFNIGTKVARRIDIDQMADQLILPKKYLSEVDTVSKNFNKEPSKLADDQNNVKDFDVPNEAAYKNQASNLEGSMFDVSTSSAIKTEAGTGAAAKTSPKVELDNFQDLSLASQKTAATPSSSVLATATTNPPLVRGSTINKVGDKSAISNKLLYHVSNDFNEIINTLSTKMNDVKAELQPIATKYNGDLKARIKDKVELQKKLDDGIRPESIPDYLGTRISVKTIHDAQMVINDLNKTVKFIQIDDFLNDAGRAGSEYRAIHAQGLTKDGYTFELQIRLKELENLTEQSHAIYKKRKWGMKTATMAEWNKLLKDEKAINKKLKNKYFQIKEKEFARLKSNDPLDREIPYALRIDDTTGERVPVTITMRETFEQAAKDETMLNRLKDCV
jgi:aryl carrier-like protein